MLWSAPIWVGASVVLWLIAEINDNTTVWFDAGMIVFTVVSIDWTNHETSRRKQQELLPRRQQLTDLLEMLSTPWRRPAALPARSRDYHATRCNAVNNSRTPGPYRPRAAETPR